jgi:hypothetical protein
VHKTWNTLDLVFTSSDISDAIIQCDTLPTLRLPGADHLPVIAILDYDLLRIPDIPRPNFRAIDWEEFNDAISTYLVDNPISLTIDSTAAYDTTYLALDKMLQNTIASHVPLLFASPYAKRWWTKELTDLLTAARKAERTNWKRPSTDAKAAEDAANKVFRTAVKTTQKQHWQDWLEEVDEKSVWLASRYASRPFTDGSAERIPALKHNDGTLASDAQEKCDILFETFFPPAPPTNMLRIPDDFVYPEPVSMPDFTRSMYDEVIRKAKPCTWHGRCSLHCPPENLPHHWRHPVGLISSHSTPQIRDTTTKGIIHSSTSETRSLRLLPCQILPANRLVPHNQEIILCHAQHHALVRIRKISTHP